MSRMRNVIGAALILATSCSFAAINIIPKPNQIKEVKEASFLLTEQTGIRFSDDLKGEAKILANSIKAATGLKLRLVPTKASIALPSQIVLTTDSKVDSKEGYTLSVGPKKVVVKGADATGVFYGTQSLLQLIPLDGKPVLPGCVIEDQPRFGWRGMHLDVARHFYPVENIKTFIDQLAVHKMNTLHMHLTDDQGWRIEIKKYPKLTEVGAWRTATPPYGDRWRKGGDGKRYGGFYSQKEMKELVAYARARHITILPEIELPGHMAAALAAYPEFGNDDIPNYNPEVKTFWGVHPYTLSPKESSFKFLEDVFTEVCDIFDSKYIHIGGDEAPKKQWKQSKFAQQVMKREGCKNEHDLQSYIIKRVEKILEKEGRKLIGWDEIREGGLSPNATVMLWRYGKGYEAKSIEEGHDVVMAPNKFAYFDHYQNKRSRELAKGVEYECIGGYRPIESVYSFEPVPKQFLGTEKAKHILGCQGQLWSEYMHTWDKVEYCAFPRVAALAEVAWTERQSMNYQEFRKRLDVMAVRYKRAGINAFDQSTFDDGNSSFSLKEFKVTTSFDKHKGNTVTSILDGKPETFFWSNSSPRKNDHITIIFDKVKGGETVMIKTGMASQYKDYLEAGVLEVSKDGKSWTELAKFVKGAVQAKLPAKTKGMRIRVTKNQNTWLQVQDIDFVK